MKIPIPDEVKQQLEESAAAMKEMTCSLEQIVESLKKIEQHLATKEITINYTHKE